MRMTISKRLRKAVESVKAFWEFFTTKQCERCGCNGAETEYHDRYYVNGRTMCRDCHLIQAREDWMAGRTG